MNIKFCYRYRDYANYKKYNEIVFSNPNNRAIEGIEKFIKEHLFDDVLFYSTEWNVPDLHFEDWDPEIDHFVHEFDSVVKTGEVATMRISVDEFLDIIERANNNWLL